ncbi:hypothetical protein [Azospirillum agricola]|uniref:hypothetical protein n=1 Tax=Azospirillum agricola TaxID=1720247 RepID=UPI001177B0DD|nr:hypothetical protein [Azospirillum agricola]
MRDEPFWSSVFPVRRVIAELTVNWMEERGPMSAKRPFSPTPTSPPASSRKGVFAPPSVPSAVKHNIAPPASSATILPKLAVTVPHPPTIVPNLASSPKSWATPSVLNLPVDHSAHIHSQPHTARISPANPVRPSQPTVQPATQRPAWRPVTIEPPPARWQPMGLAIQPATVVRADPAIVKHPGRLVIQRMNFNTKTTVALEDQIQDLLTEMECAGDTGDNYVLLNKIFNLFDSGSNKSSVIAEIKKEVGPNPQGTMKNLIDWLSNPKNLNNSIRETNYGNYYNSTAKKKMTDYVKNNPGVLPNTWICPVGVGHVALNSDASIDHVDPVAKHWNDVGYNSNRSTRTTWYTDESNHVTVCRSCNSSMGSGGIRYRITTGANYSN